MKITWPALVAEREQLAAESGHARPERLAEIDTRMTAIWLQMRAMADELPTLELSTDADRRLALDVAVTIAADGELRRLIVRVRDSLQIAATVAILG